MGTLLGMGLFSAAAAITVDRIYTSVVHSNSAIANVGQYGAFIGTWTTVGVASSMRKVSRSSGRLKGRIKSIRKKEK